MGWWGDACDDRVRGFSQCDYNVAKLTWDNAEKAGAPKRPEGWDR